ncbi:MAG TPA: TonB-dependent receptor [Caldimonas sp.]|nr:TonB-dependent receptor [Caldimonas sp.]
MDLRISVSRCSRRPAACLLAALVVAPHARGQPARNDLAPIAIVGTREPAPVERLVGDVVVIDAERIRASSADSIEDLLRRAGGMQLSRNGGPGQNAAVLMRGTAASGTLVLVDGVRVGSATLGQFDFSMLNLADIERIEVLRGPASSLYGADALGGVILIVTKQGRGAWRFGAHALAGELQSSAVDASVAGSQGPLDLAASVAREASHGVSALRPNDAFGAFNPDRDGYVRTSASVRGGYALAPGQRIGVSALASRINAQFDSVEFPAPSFMPDASGDFRNHGETRLAALDYRGTVTPTWTTSARLSTQTDDLESGAREVSRFVTRRQQATWQNAWTPWAGQQIVGALEHLDESVDGTPFAGTLTRRTSAALLGYDGGWQQWHVQADARHDDNSVYGGVTTGKLGIGYDLRPGLTLRVLGGTAFRAPSFNDLFFPGFGVPTVTSERSHSIEAGVRWRTDDASLGATVYRNRINDLIVFEPDRTFCPPDPAYDFGCARNVARARIRGATLDGTWTRGRFDVHAAIDFLDAHDADTGERLPRRAAHQESVDAHWSRGDWKTGIAVLNVGARPDAGAQLGSYALVDLQAFWRFAPRWQAEAKLTNAFDRRYEPLRDYNAPGRQAWIGVRYESDGVR